MFFSHLFLLLGFHLFFFLDFWRIFSFLVKAPLHCKLLFSEELQKFYFDFFLVDLNDLLSFFLYLFEFNILMFVKISNFTLIPQFAQSVCLLIQKFLHLLLLISDNNLINLTINHDRESYLRFALSDFYFLLRRIYAFQLVVDDLPNLAFDLIQLLPVNNTRGSSEFGFDSTLNTF